MKTLVQKFIEAMEEPTEDMVYQALVKIESKITPEFVRSGKTSAYANGTAEEYQSMLKDAVNFLPNSYKEMSDSDIADCIGDDPDMNEEVFIGEDGAILDLVMEELGYDDDMADRIISIFDSDKRCSDKHWDLVQKIEKIIINDIKNADTRDIDDEDDSVIEQRIINVCRNNGAKGSFTTDDGNVYHNGTSLTYDYFVYKTNPSYRAIANNIDAIAAELDKYGISANIDDTYDAEFDGDFGPNVVFSYITKE